MINQIGSFGSANSMNIAISNSAKLTAATKAKLEALGIDTSHIATEAEGQAILKTAEAKQEEVKKVHANKGGFSAMKDIKAEAKELAAKIGVSISDNDKMDNILNKISEKINELRASAGNEPNKSAQIAQYQSRLDSISNEFLNMKSSKSQLNGSMNALAFYNKIYQNLK